MEDDSIVFPSLGRPFKIKWWNELKNDVSILVVHNYFQTLKSLPWKIYISFSLKQQIQA